MLFLERVFVRFLGGYFFLKNSKQNIAALLLESDAVPNASSSFFCVYIQKNNTRATHKFIKKGVSRTQQPTMLSQLATLCFTLKTVCRLTQTQTPRPAIIFVFQNEMPFATLTNNALFAQKTATGTWAW